jgi:uncharacterized membrane protein
MLKRLAGPFFIFTGTLHFVIPESFIEIMPPYLPAHRELVYASGVAEIAGGAGLMHPRARPWAGRWLIATLVAVFPANVNMALNAKRYAKSTPGGNAALIARLPLQLILIAWVKSAAKRR